jgi:hypothetical protein
LGLLSFRPCGSIACGDCRQGKEMKNKKKQIKKKRSSYEEVLEKLLPIFAHIPYTVSTDGKTVTYNFKAKA